MSWGLKEFLPQIFASWALFLVKGRFSEINYGAKVSVSKVFFGLF